jgi:hypothetical protein
MTTLCICGTCALCKERAAKLDAASRRVLAPFAAALAEEVAASVFRLRFAPKAEKKR